MLAARMHAYKEPLVVEEIKVPELSPEEVLVNVGGAGMCRSDVQLVDGYFGEALKPELPITLDRRFNGRAVIVFDIDGGTSESGGKGVRPKAQNALQQEG
jgi:alcohol dehydrogenase, propanol-preferring